MKNSRAPRPAPRTLSADPPAALRAPKSASYQARFPSLVAVLAGGVLAPACYDVECGSNRADELDRHGMRALSQLSSGHASQAVTEVGVALGVVSHTSTTRPLNAGAMPVATTTPPLPPPPVVPPPDERPIMTQGEPMPVGPTPVDVAPPTPPQPTRPTQVAPTHSQPHTSPPRSQIRGGARRVDPQPRSRGDIISVGPLPGDPNSPSNRRV